MITGTNMMMSIMPIFYLIYHMVYGTLIRMNMKQYHTHINICLAWTIDINIINAYISILLEEFNELIKERLGEPALRLSKGEAHQTKKGIDDFVLLNSSYLPNAKNQPLHFFGRLQ